MATTSLGAVCRPGLSRLDVEDYESGQYVSQMNLQMYSVHIIWYVVAVYRKLTDSCHYVRPVQLLYARSSTERRRVLSVTGRPASVPQQ